MESIDQTLIVIKPDGFRRRLTGRILSRLEDKGLEIKKIRALRFNKNQAEEFYRVHSGKPFFNELISAITSGTVIACVIEGNNAVEVVRLLIGSTKSFEASPGTIRGDFGLGITENIVHASDSAESFIKESKVIFG